VFRGVGVTWVVWVCGAFDAGGGNMIDGVDGLVS